MRAQDLIVFPNGLYDGIFSLKFYLMLSMCGSDVNACPWSEICYVSELEESRFRLLLVEFKILNFQDSVQRRVWVQQLMEDFCNVYFVVNST